MKGKWRRFELFWFKFSSTSFPFFLVQARGFFNFSHMNVSNFIMLGSFYLWLNTRLLFHEY